MKPEDIPQDIWDDLEGFRTQPFHWKGPEEVALLLAYAAKAEREACARYVEGHGDVIPGSAVFASLVSRNNMPCMSGDPRDRLHSHVRRSFDDATDALAAAIRNRGKP